jgi:hypothetical protein
MNKHVTFLLVISVMLLSGCMTSIEKLNKLHTPAVMSPRLISQSAWAVDKKSFITLSTAIEVMPGGRDGSRGDFSSVFESNASQLMASLFGTEKAHVSIEQAEYVLRIQIGNVFTKCGISAFAESQNDIQLTFNLIHRQNGKEVAIAPVSVTGSIKGMTGGLDCYDKAHIRTNEAINTAFIKAQAGLADALAK